MKARQAVGVSRLELDAAKQTYVICHFMLLRYPSSSPTGNFLALSLTFLLTDIAQIEYSSRSTFYSLKGAGPTKQEQARLEVENAEDDLVQKTEVAITLMKTVLENVRPNLFFTYSRLLN